MVEHTTENRGVAGSIPALAIGFFGSAERLATEGQYGPRLESLTEDLADRLPDWSWTAPAGGFTLWARLPHGADARAFAAAALRNGVSVVPGTRLSPEERHGDCVRLAFMLDPGSSRAVWSVWPRHGSACGRRLGLGRRSPRPACSCSPTSSSSSSSQVTSPSAG